VQQLHGGGWNHLQRVTVHSRATQQHQHRPNAFAGVDRGRRAIGVRKAEVIVQHRAQGVGLHIAGDNLVHLTFDQRDELRECDVE